MMSRGSPALGFLVVFLLLVSAVSAVAKEGDPMASGQERHLNGHGFLPSVYVSDPFVSTSFQNHTGGGMAMNLTTTFKDLEGNDLFELSSDLFFAALGMGYQQKLGTKWALGAEVSALVRSGTNAESFLTEGADIARQAHLWAKYRLKRSEKCQISLGLDFNYASALFFTPYDFARYIYETGDIENAPILTDSKVSTTRLTFNWARGFSRAFGLRINGDFGFYDEPETSGVIKGSHRLGILGELDLQGTGARVPLGFTLGYTLALPTDDPLGGLSGLLLGFWYTGKEDFDVGLETGFMEIPMENRDSDKVDAQFGLFTIKYYF